MKREDFIKLGSAGIAAAATGQITLPGSPAVDRKRLKNQDASTVLKKGFMLGTFPSGGSYSYMERFQLLRDAGFDGVEPGSGIDRSAILEAKEATGLEIPSVVVSTHWSSPLSSPDPVVRDRGIAGLQTALHDAAEYGATCILLVPGVVNAEVSYADVYQRSQAVIRNMIPLAQELGIIIAIENVWNNFLLSPLEAARYIDEFESPYVGWYFDIGNIINYGWPSHWIRILGDRIVMTHIKEFSREKRDDEGLWNGFDVNFTEGDNNWPEIMSALREVGYTGYGIAEPAYRPNDVPVDVWLRDYISGRMDTIFTM